MNKYLRLAAIMAALAILVSYTSAASAREVVARVVAVVDDEVITSQDLENMLELMKAQLAQAGRSPQSSQDIAALRRMALDRLIGEKIFAQEVARRNITVRDAEIDAFVKRIMETNGLSEEAFVARLTQKGLTMESYREQLKRDILRRRLIARSVHSRVAVSDAQIDEYYRTHMSSMSTMGGVSFKAIFIMVPSATAPAARDALRQKAADLRKQVKDGGDFAALAKEHSQGPGKDNAGVVGPLKADDLLPPMRQALAEMKPGELSEVVEIPGGFVFMELLDRSGKSNLPSAEERAQIRQKLEKEAFEARYNAWLKELRSKTYVRILEQ